MPKGEFTTEWAPADFDVTCPHCHARVEFRCWESADGGHEDTQYRCRDCHTYWWEDGPDA